MGCDCTKRAHQEKMMASFQMGDSELGYQQVQMKDLQLAIEFVQGKTEIALDELVQFLNMMKLKIPD